MSRISTHCHICGDAACGLNFNVITCMSCKSFFRRHAHKKSVSFAYIFKKSHDFT